MKKLLFLIILLSANMLVIQAQTRKVTGTVTLKEDGSSAPGVNVIVKGTTIGTITDLNGKYQIEMPQGSTTLVFSYVGMKTVEVPVESPVVDIQLEPEVVGLNEVLVVGYGSRLKTELTGSISRLQGKEIENLPVPTMESTMQGRTAGVFIENSSGKLGEGLRVRIRGTSSISADNQPLYVVDGMVVTSQSQGIDNNSPTNPMADINPADIESINILKDASAAAIYGSRAANGVVLITTKRGKAGRTQFNIGYQIGTSQPTHKIDLMNADEYRKYFIETFTRSYGDEATAIDVLNYYIPYFSGYFNGTDTVKYNTNWQDEAFQRGSLQQIELSATGGNEKTQFYTGLVLNDQKGILLGNKLNRVSGRLNLDHSPTRRIKMGMNFGLTRSMQYRVSDDNSYSTPLQMIALPPVQPKYDPEDPKELFKNTYYENGLIPAKYNDFLTTIIRNLSGAYLSYEPFAGLTWRSEVGVDILSQREKNYLSRKTNDGAPSGLGESRAVEVLNFSTDNYLTFSKDFAEVNNVEVVAGITYQQSNTEETSNQARGFPSDDFKTIANATEPVYFSSSGTEYKYMSYFSRANLKLLDRYLLTVSGRMDGSSRFGKNHRYGFFPAASLGWIISREGFLQNQKVISFLKIRASYGLTGNSEIDNFASMGLYTGSNYAGTVGIRPVQLPSPDLKWETTAQTDAGIDFGFLNNRITGEVDVYYKKTNDLLLFRLLPATSGFTSFYRNVGSLENKGLEFVINTNNLTGRFQWSTQFNIGFNRNKILNIDGPPIMAENTRTGNNMAIEGYPIGVFYLPKYAGVAPDDVPGGNPDGSDIYGGDALYYVKKGSKEVTNDYNQAESMVIGDPNPDFYGGFNNTFSFKGFDLSFLFQYVYGNDIYKSHGTWAESNGWNLDNQTRKMEKGWKKPGDKTDVPRADWDIKNGSQPSSRYLEDGSYIRLKSLTLGYTFPRSVTDRMKLNSVRIYFSGANLLTFTKYTGWDPEVNYTGTNRTQTNQNLIQGSEFYTAPQAKSFTMGITVGL